MRDKYDTWLKALTLAWLWGSALVVVSGLPRVWGMIPLGRGAGLWMLPVAAVLTVLVFAVRDKPLESLLRWLSSYWPGRRKGFFRAAAWSAACLPAVLLAWFFRSRNHFLGDGWAMIDQVGKRFAYYRNEPLDFFIHQSFHRLLGRLGVSGGETGYAVLHCLLLPVFLLVCWKIASRLTGDAVERAALWLLALGTGSLQFFFGYVENYTLQHLWLGVFFLAGVRYLQQQDRRNPWLPAAVFVIALATHRSTACFLPGFLYLWFERSRLGAPLRRQVGSSVSVFLVSALALALVLGVAYIPGLIPVAGEIDGADMPYRMFEAAHLWDKLNFLLLVCPVAVVSAPLLAAGWRRLSGAVDPALVFLFWSAAGGVFFSFVINPHLGVRDWDLMSAPALPLAFFCGLGLVRLMDRKGHSRAALFVLAVSLLVHSLTWVWVNADMGRGVRFLDLVRRVDYHTGQGKVQLGFMLGELGFFKEAAGQYLLVEGEGKSRAYLNLVQTFWKRGMPDSTVYYCREFLSGPQADAPSSVPLFVVLCMAYDSAEKPDSATMYYLDMRARGLQPAMFERQAWISRMNRISGRYNLLIEQKPLDEGLLQFFLRYYTIKQDRQNLDRVYRHILGNDFQDGAWLKFLEFAVLCNHEDYIKLLALEALRQHPDLDIELEYTDRDTTGTNGNR